MSVIPNSTHLLVYPFPTSGHIIPLIDLTHRLLARGLTVTFLVTPPNRPLLEPLIFSHQTTASFHFLILPEPPISPPSSTTRNPLVSRMISLRDLHYPALVEWFKSLRSPPVAILSDFFLAWTHELASELCIRRIVFSPSGAFAYSVSAATWHDLPKNDTPNEDPDFQISFPKLPGSPNFPWYQITPLYRSSQEGDPEWEFMRKTQSNNSKSWGIIFNSFTELERVYIDHMKQEMGEDRVWAVGPVLPVVDVDDRGGASAVSSRELLTWLDAREGGSVVYVCFGSRENLKEEQTDVLAAALEQSGVNFIWCFREKEDNPNRVGFLNEFKERVSGRGLLIRGWAPQVTILQHRAVGAFLTHCGWNSTLEAIAAGVIMLTWPMGADQYSNAILLVDELRVGVRVGEGIQNIPETNELARLIGQSVNNDKEPMRDRVKVLQEAAASAVTGGSSDKDLDHFVKTLEQV